jgi:geranylgeranyl pyrophosphate synthase
MAAAAGADPMSGTTDIFSPLPEIERALGACSDALESPERLRDAVRYALLGGGKRFRPLLAWHSAEAVGAPGARAIHAGVAVELVHAFSLVHDDLPAMDDDDLRRGKPTLHVHAGEAMAILAGDQMLTSAFAHLLARVEPVALAGALCTELARGTTGMISGQVLDTLGGEAGEATPLEKLRRVHANKTGALIRAACRMGGLCGLGTDGIGHPNLDALSRYAEAIGLAFQITDDLLDVEATTDQAGKRTGKDAQAGKLTYPTVLGIEASRAEARRQLAAARAALSELPGRTAGLEALASFVVSRTH